MGIWGIDLGGTKIEGVILNDSNLEVVWRNRIPTEADKGYDHIVSQIKALVDLMKGETGELPTKIGIGTPGALDPYSRTMKNCNTTSLNGKPLHEDLERLLEIPVVLANDANCFALAETEMGSVKESGLEAEVVFGIIMGTGVGGGIVVNGKLINGKHGIGGEWGHNFLDESGGPCYCGKIGCVEKVLAGPSLETFYHQESGQQKKLKEIYKNYQAGNDPFASKTIQRLMHFFGKGVAQVMNIIDPDIVVIGGGVGNINELYTLGKKELYAYLFNNRLDTLFLKPTLGDSAGVFGAALLVK